MNVCWEISLKLFQKFLKDPRNAPWEMNSVLGAPVSRVQEPRLLWVQRIVQLLRAYFIRGSGVKHSICRILYNYKQRCLLRYIFLEFKWRQLVSLVFHSDKNHFGGNVNVLWQVNWPHLIEVWVNFSILSETIMWSHVCVSVYNLLSFLLHLVFLLNYNPVCIWVLLIVVEYRCSISRQAFFIKILNPNESYVQVIH